LAIITARKIIAEAGQLIMAWTSRIPKCCETAMSMPPPIAQANALLEGDLLPQGPVSLLQALAQKVAVGTA
jgi:hypothetical protein